MAEFKALNINVSSTSNRDLFTMLNMETLQSRFQKAKKHWEGLNSSRFIQADLVRHTGASKGTISLWFVGNTQTISWDFASKAADYFGVNVRWLQTGEGEMLRQSGSIAVPYDSDMNLDGLRLPENKDFMRIPLMNASASMGDGEAANDQELVVDVLRISKDWAHKNLGSVTAINNLSFIHGIGLSMAPTFSDGDILLVDTGVKVADTDDVFVLYAHERLFIKRVRRTINGDYEISSDNPAVKTVDILNGQHEVAVLGKVVWAWNGRKV